MSAGTGGPIGVLIPIPAQPTLCRESWPPGGTHTPDFSWSGPSELEGVRQSTPTGSWACLLKVTLRSQGPHSPVEGILVGVGHVHDVNETTISCREKFWGMEGREAPCWGWWSLSQPYEA